MSLDSFYTNPVPNDTKLLFGGQEVIQLDPGLPVLGGECREVSPLEVHQPVGSLFIKDRHLGREPVAGPPIEFEFIGFLVVLEVFILQRISKSSLERLGFVCALIDASIPPWVETKNSVATTA